MNERGFYIAFDNETPKRPKPPLRTRSPGKRRDGSTGPNDRSNVNTSRDLTTEYIQSIVDHVPIPNDDDDHDETFHHSRRRSRSRNDSEGLGEQTGGELVIDEKSRLDPVR